MSHEDGNAEERASIKNEDGHGNGHSHDSDNNQGVFFATIMFFQVLILLLFATKFDYTKATTGAEANNANQRSLTDIYPLFQDVHVMIFIGFGFLMTFLRKYGYSAIGLNMLIAAIVLQWQMTAGVLLEKAIDGHASETVMLDATSLIKGDFGAGAVLISFGAVLGRVTPTQCIWMGMMEILFYAVNEYIGAINLQAVDMGGSIFVHTFGAYFGLACSWMLGAPEDSGADEEAVNSYHSDLFSMIGTIFLWMFWPSFNGALSDALAGGQRQRVIINTVLAIAASCTTAFAFSKYLGHGGKFEMEHIQNATLAGGVAVGSSSDLVIGPWGAVLIGILAGAVSTTGYLYMGSFLEETFGIYDTCGVHNLHGMPGLMGAIFGAISAAAASEEAYGENIQTIFAGRAKADGSCCSKTAGEQGGVQISALLITLAFSIVGGLITGKFIKWAFPAQKLGYQDEPHWDVPADYAFNGEARRVSETQPLVAKDVNVEIAQS